MALILKISSLFKHFERPAVLVKSLRNQCRQFGAGRNPVAQVNKSKVYWEIDTKVTKDVVLFNHDNTKFHRTLNIFAVAQFFFWTYSAQFAYTTLRDVPVANNVANSEDLSWYRKMNLGENKFRNGITILCISVGSLILGCSWLYALKSVQTVVLRKGGQMVTFITHGPFNKLRYLDAPLNQVSAAQSRSGAAVNLPVKVKGHMGFLLIDMRGQFHNTVLFDATVGLKRMMK
nr:EOG090X0JX7 [Sida crystallina]